MIRKNIQPSVGIVFLVGLILKFMHLPGAGITIFISLSAAVLLLIAQTLGVTGQSLLSNLYRLAILSGAIYIVSILFKVMHWPGANIMLIVSMSALSAILASLALKTRTWYYALLPLIFSLTLMMALFKIMHWPRPHYLLYGSYFAFTGILIAVLFHRSKELKETEQKLSSTYSMLGVFTLLIFAVELKLKWYPNLFEVSENPTRIALLILFASVAAIIHRLLIEKPYSTELQKDRRILKTIQGIYLIMLVMMVLYTAH